MSDNETIHISATGGKKAGNLERYDLIPTEPWRMLAKHFGVGSLKYDDDNWRKGYDWRLSYAALQRHINQFWAGEDIDDETGSPHVIAAAWHCVVLAWFMEHRREFDTRSEATEKTPSKIVYVSGPMTGYPEFNHPAFHETTRRLRSLGMEVINPAELDDIDGDTTRPWDYYLRRDLAAMMPATHIYLLPGWSKSKGAKLELHVAKSLGMEVAYQAGAERDD